MPQPPAFNPLATDRRALLRAGTAGLGLAATPAWAGFALAGSGFTHGVASGEPDATSVLLWTRYVAPGETRLRYELAETIDFARVIREGEALASPEADCCAKATATALEPGRWYYYRFIAPNGAISDIGRTRTLPEGKLDRFRIAVFSCANLGFGWFNAYAHAAEDGAFDLVAHLGDYYYEYKRGEYPDPGEGVAERVAQVPVPKAVHLADYRARHADYRADPDLRRLFQLYPWVMIWDDHETANDSWKAGAENHQPETEGPWPAREAAALKAYREWLPVSDAPWKAYEIGDLATLFRLETRLTARDEQFSLGKLTQGSDAEVRAALARFRDGEWRDPARQLMGAEQEAWLAEAMQASRRAGKPWQVLAQQVVMGTLFLPPSVAETIPAAASAGARRRIVSRVTASSVGVPFNMDAWDGYPAARERLLASARAADANLIVLSGDSHNAWANNLMSGKAAAGVEFGGHSVTSPGAEDSLPWMDPARLARDLVTASPGLAWCDTSRRGYMAVELTPATASCEWRLLDSVRTRSTRLAGTHTLGTEPGRNAFA